MLKSKKILLRFWPFLVFAAIWIILFLPFFKKGLLPIPADIITGMYYPWLDYKWGFPAGVPVKNPLMSDVPSLLYPWRSFAIDELKAGRWPLWNPYYFGGMPLLANFQSAVFSYVNVFYFFFSKEIAWSIGVILSSLLTMVAFYAFLRNKKLSKLPCVFGSIVFSLSGFQIAWMEYNVLGHTALFIPLLLLAIDKYLGEKKTRWGILISVFTAMQIFTGYVPIVIYTYIICGLYVFYYYIFNRYFIENIKRIIITGLYFVWGILIASIQLFPGIELIKESIRKVDPTVLASNASFLPFKNIITFIAPDSFGNPTTGNYFGFGFYDNFFLFVGTGTLVLVIYSVMQLLQTKKNNNIVIWLILLLFSFLLIFENPFGLFLEKLLFLSGGVSARAIFILDFSMAVLASYGLEVYIQQKTVSKKILFLTIMPVFILFIFASKVALEEGFFQKFISIRNLVIPAGIYFITAFLFILGGLVSKTKSLTSIFLVIFCVIQLLYGARKYLPFSKREMVFPKTPILDFLVNENNKSREPFRVELFDVIPQNFLMPYKIQTTSGYDTLLPKRTGELFSLIETGSISKNISRVWLISNYNSLVYPLLNTKYVLVKKMDKEGKLSSLGTPPSFVQNSRYKLAFEDKVVQVYEDTRFLPRAFWLYDYQIINSQDDFIELIQSEINLNKTILLEKKPNIKIIDNRSKINNVYWNKNSPGEILLKVESDKSGFILLSNNYFPGWYGFIDGKKTEILRANYTFQAIASEKGNHEIKLIFNPLSFRLGMIISTISILFLLLKIFLKHSSIFQKIIKNCPFSK